ncbi:MAG: alpha/beta hydrolase [Sporichthyaceae bacterium]
MGLPEITFDSHGARCAAWHLGAESGALTTTEGRPAVIMGHGFGATRDAGLLPYAERFAGAGADVVVFDYRGYGTSGGEPRQDVNHLRHRQDYHAAVAHARALPGIDPDRIVLWGSSYAGGHVLPVAVKDGRIAAVISQGAAMDGARALVLMTRTAGIGHVLRITGWALRDLAATATGRRPFLVPVVGEPGSRAVITAPGSMQGYGAIMGPTFRNEMRARGILGIAANRPVTSARKLTCPSLFVIAEGDNVAPAAAVKSAARKAGSRAEILTLDVGHFDIYVGQTFQTSVAAQVEFMVRHLAPR